MMFKEVIKKAKHSVGDKVILLDFSNETQTSYREHNHFWVQPMNNWIGRIFTIEHVFRESNDKLFWYKMVVDKDQPNWGYNEHWLQGVSPLDDELFEI